MNVNMAAVYAPPPRLILSTTCEGTLYLAYEIASSWAPTVEPVCHAHDTKLSLSAPHPPLPTFPTRHLGAPGTPLQFVLRGHVGQRGCHRLDELLIPKLRIENLEVLAGCMQQTLICSRG